ncbi:tRNA pseudouridine(38-40) synthase TruA [Ureaplasma canigenitalium]|uniref:tRNA pseudouridine(38-40) synthase TruA n=1 Tax=Ureaplasma canigenitalium TaxID=42092 RepID=UPI0004E2355D|nr:tRNA pseudouridine(38-40) synthase TruA [Ureaplasma canigenitalium]
MNYKLIIQYDGSHFFGSASQKNKQTVEDVLTLFLRERLKNDHLKIIFSGRTDRGVHALGQVINIHIDNKIPADSLKKMINRHFRYIKVIDSVVVDDAFNARFDAVSKTYQFLLDTEQFSLFKKDYVWQLKEKINLNKLIEIKDVFIGEHDFLSFSTSELENTKRIINWITIEKKDFIEITINGNGFLRSMVRMIVGIMVKYATNKISKEEIISFLSEPRKGSGNIVAPASGLYLVNVYYD